ncbi:putative glycosidase C21B10.07 [Hypsizygus marmoreus]|uniref:Glycosidase C21B10.07 n=1 Tax=Hypsizygus marmoreus TaxID=39966 RepID=A0A369JDA5_HYPMA|nr:putative glycosidase C21B10.07 [Hypsizygus marmoreus]
MGLALTYTVAARTWYIKDTYVGTDFLTSWKWETLDDPTHGRVNYVDQPSALNSNLTYASDDKFIMRADAYQIVPPSARGRDSVRITSKKAYDESLIVLDLNHMPTGCGTWPAFWTLSRAGPWPNGGEIDIIEGVHTNTKNLASLHTTPGCTMSEPRGQNGDTVSSNCDTSVSYNQGCGTSFKKPNSYGAPFNAVGGGFFAIQRSKSSVAVWFWTRDDPAVPQAVRTGVGNVSVDESWGLPEARFPMGDGCGYEEHMDRHVMIFDTTFCGDWAGATYTSAGCPGTCNDYVNNNPEKFTEAYWEINALRVYV